MIGLLKGYNQCNFLRYYNINSFLLSCFQSQDDWVPIRFLQEMYTSLKDIYILYRSNIPITGQETNSPQKVLSPPEGPPLTQIH